MFPGEASKWQISSLWAIHYWTVAAACDRNIEWNKETFGFHFESELTMMVISSLTHETIIVAYSWCGVCKPCGNRSTCYTEESRTALVKKDKKPRWSYCQLCNKKIACFIWNHRPSPASNIFRVFSQSISAHNTILAPGTILIQCWRLSKNHNHCLWPPVASGVKSGCNPKSEVKWSDFMNGPGGSQLGSNSILRLVWSYFST